MEIDCVFQLDFALFDLEQKEQAIKNSLARDVIPDDSEYEAVNELRSKLRSTPGVSELMKLAMVESAEFGEHWLDRKRCILHIDHQVESIDVSRMRIPEFAAKLLEIRKSERTGHASNSAMGKNIPRRSRRY